MEEQANYAILDSGQRREFSTGAQRDRGEVKARPDLLHPYFLFRFGTHMAKGAEKYDAWNWSKGMPLSEWFASLHRHVVMAMAGDEREDHLSAICFNAMGAMVTKAGIKAGVYPAELDDMPDFSGWVPYLMEKARGCADKETGTGGVGGFQDWLQKKRDFAGPYSHKCPEYYPCY